jgi:hypothetical protein
MNGDNGLSIVKERQKCRSKRNGNRQRNGDRKRNRWLS